MANLPSAITAKLLNMIAMVPMQMANLARVMAVNLLNIIRIILMQMVDLFKKTKIITRKAILRTQLRLFLALSRPPNQELAYPKPRSYSLMT